MNMTGKAMRKENGSTLVVVLLVIAVFSVLGLSLIGVSVTRSQQTTQETDQIQATNTAEMGLKAYDQKIQTALTLINASQPKSFADMENQVTGLITANKLPDDLISGSDIRALQGNPQYEVTMVKHPSSDSNKITLSLTSTGTVNGEQRKISQDQVFTYDPKYTTPEFNGLSLPYMEGSVIVNPDQWNIIGNGNKDNIQIFDAGGQLTDPTYQQVDLTGIEQAFENMRMASEADQSNPVTGNVVSGNVYANAGSIGFSTTRTFNGDVYINGDVTITGNVTFNGNVHINGSLNVQKPGNVNVNGNLFVSNDLGYSYGDQYNGYVYVGESLNRTNSGNSGDVVFNQTVYVNGSFDASETGNKSDLYFNKGVVLGGGASPHVSGKSYAYFHPQEKSTTSPVNPVTAASGNTQYQ